jgi:hypothetical protein
MPCLEELKVTVIANTDGSVAFPAEAVAVASGYIISAFRLIRTFQLTIEWRSSRALQESPSTRFLPEPTRDALARLDGLLTDTSLLGSLNEMGIYFELVYVGDDEIKDELAGGLRSRIQSEILEALHGAVGRVDNFSVTTSPSALK